jgi:hypothetical protein
VFFVTRKVQGKCQEVAGNVISKILCNVMSAGTGRSWLCVGQGQGVLERKRKTEMMTMTVAGSDSTSTSVTAYLRQFRYRVLRSTA